MMGANHTLEGVVERGESPALGPGLVLQLQADVPHVVLVPGHNVPGHPQRLKKKSSQLALTFQRTASLDESLQFIVVSFSLFTFIHPPPVWCRRRLGQ